MTSRNRGSITQKKPGVYLVRVTLGTDWQGKRITKAKTIRGTKKQAQEALARLILETGTDRDTFGEATANWLELYQSKVSSSTWARKDQLLRTAKRLAPDFFRMKIDNITASDIESLVALMREKGRDMAAPNARNLTNTQLATNTVKQFRQAVSAIFKQLEKDRKITVNPARLADPLKGQAVRAEHIELPDIQLLLDRLSGVYRSVAQFCIASGVRRGEALALTWHDIDLRAGRVKVTKSVKRVGDSNSWEIGAPKTRSGVRTITLPEYEVHRLRVLKADQSAGWERIARHTPRENKWFVFPNVTDPTTYANPHTITSKISQACKALGIKGSLHSLRHSHASLLLATESLPAVSARLGHAGPHITSMVYSHQLKGSDEQAAESINRLFAHKLHIKQEELPKKACNDSELEETEHRS